MEHATEQHEATDHGFQWVSVSNGRFTLYHRPKVTALEFIKSTGCTHIATLLTEKEGAVKLGESIKKAGLNFVWLPIQGADLPTINDIEPFHEKIKELARLLAEEKASVLIHCSAGLHRTGMVGMSLMRYLGNNKDEAHLLVKNARELTARDVGEHRIAFSQIFVEIFGTRSDPKSSEETKALLTDYNTRITDIQPTKQKKKQMKLDAQTVSK